MTICIARLAASSIDFGIRYIHTKPHIRTFHLFVMYPHFICQFNFFFFFFQCLTIFHFIINLRGKKGRVAVQMIANWHTVTHFCYSILFSAIVFEKIACYAIAKSNQLENLCMWWQVDDRGGIKKYRYSIEPTWKTVILSRLQKNLCMYRNADDRRAQMHSTITSLKSIKAHIDCGLTEHQRFISSSLSNCHRVNDDKEHANNSTLNEIKKSWFHWKFHRVWRALRGFITHSLRT